MPVSCAASGCKSRYTLEARKKGITFHRFPRSNPALLDKWRVAMKRATITGELWMPSRYQRLCSLHFKQSCFDTTGQTKRLRDDVIPSIFNFTEDMQTQVSESLPKEESGPSTASMPPTPEAVSETPAVETVAGKNEAAINCVPLQDHLYFIPDVETLKRKLQASEESRAQKEKELRNAKDREKRLRQPCPSIYKEIRKRKLLSPLLQEKLQTVGDIPLELFRKPECEYSPQQRLFCLTLQLYDPMSYKHLRNEFKLPLPGPRKLRQWLKTDGDKPGVNILVLEALLEKKQEHPKLYTRASLALDTMSIQQHVAFNSQRNELVGFVGLGNGVESSGNKEVANEVIMFMLVATAGDWKAPIAYFLMNSLTAEAQRQLLFHVLHELCEHGFEIVAITMERLLRNREMCSLLGCGFHDPTQLQTHFSLPNKEKKHYIIFDVNYEQNMIQELLEETGTLHSPDGTITWKQIDDAMNVQKHEIQMNKDHFIQKQIIRQLTEISLAVNKLTYTIGNSLSTLHELKYETLVESTASIVFIQAIEEYLLSLTTSDNCRLYQGPRLWNILGVLVNITSYKALLPQLLQDQDYILTHRFSTDHLKMFFNRLRKANGTDQDPTALHVKEAVKHLLGQCGLCNDLMPPMIPSLVYATGHQAPNSYLHNLCSPFPENSVSLQDHVYTSPVLDTMLHDSRMYIAGWVVRRAFGQLACTKCRCALVTKDSPNDFRSAYHLLQLKDGTAYFMPSGAVIRTVLQAEKELHHMLRTDQYRPQTACFVLQYRVLLLLGSDDIFDLKEHIMLTESGIDNHHFHLVRLVTSLFYALRQPYIAKLTQRCQYRKHMKHILTSSVFTQAL
ncbi:DNA transposase THAP9 isoform X2 [Spea bombifrons]|uniref:DNA transposase THAP9 isoform X2 n=1 Tax=Spea bombifrons TaxID=233779 RepID=UPI0023499A37|nr:DNA transposase THAP9 isoform X2 [Spea bombifrons]